MSTGGLPPGFPQVSWLVRAVSKVVNCVAVRPVVGWWYNGSSWCGLRIFVVICPQDCRLVGSLSSWWGGVCAYF